MSDMIDDEAAGPAANVLPSSRTPSPHPAAFLIIEIPLPFKGLYPNDRMSRWAKAAQYKDFVFQCRVDARNAMYRASPDGLLRCLLPPVQAQAVYNFHLNRGRDGDNLAAALKGAWDGFVRADLLRGDTLRDLHIDPVQVTIDKTRPEGVTITLTEEPRHEN